MDEYINAAKRISELANSVENNDNDLASLLRSGSERIINLIKLEKRTKSGELEVING